MRSQFARFDHWVFFTSVTRERETPKSKGKNKQVTDCWGIMLEDSKQLGHYAGRL